MVKLRSRGGAPDRAARFTSSRRTGAASANFWSALLTPRTNGVGFCSGSNWRCRRTTRTRSWMRQRVSMSCPKSRGVAGRGPRHSTRRRRGNAPISRATWCAQPPPQRGCGQQAVRGKEACAVPGIPAALFRNGESIRSYDDWTPAVIKKRTREMAGQLASVWEL